MKLKEITMNELRTLNVESDLRGMSAIESDTGNKLGEIVDALVDPLRGTLVGLSLRTTKGENLALPAQKIVIGADAIMVARRESHKSPVYRVAGTPAFTCLVGTNVVTENGTLIGQISDVYVAVGQREVGYHVTESALQDIFGGGFYIAGDIARAFSNDGMRMIVPADTTEHYAARSIEDVFDRE